MKFVKQPLLVAVALASMQSFSAHADSFGSIEYNFRDGYGVDDGTRVNGYSLNLGTYVTETTSVDIGTKFRQDNTTSDTTNRLELGLTQYVPITCWLKLYARGAVGTQFDNTDDFNYYSVEGGGVVPLSDKWSVKLGYRYRDATEQDIAYETKTIRASLTYAVSENASVFLGYDRFSGDTDVNGVNLGYAFKF